MFKSFSCWSCSVLALVFLVGLSSCQEEEAIIGSTLSLDNGLELSVEEADIEATFEEIEEIALGVEEEIEDPQRRQAAPPIELWRCATIERDTLAQTLTVDFGEGCEGEDGRVRKGKIVITFTRRLHIPGAVRSTEFIGYSVDSVEVEGKRTLTNITESGADFITLENKLEGGRITWPDGTSATRESNRTRTWVRGRNPLQDEFQVTGSVEGVNRNGISYSVSIEEALVYKRQCRRARIFIPVAGTKVFTNSERGELEVSYGEGDCDTLVTLTVGEESREVDIREEWRKRNRRR